MAVTQVYTAIPNDVISAARWNNEFGNIYNNGTDIAFPLTKAVSLAGNTLTLDSAGIVTLTGAGGVAAILGSLSVSGSLNVGSILAGKVIGGLTYAPAADASNDITVAVGEAASADATLANRRLMVLSSAITGQVDTGTWVVGTNQPKLDTGAVGNAPYYIWLIQRSDTGVVDILFSASGTAPTMPTGYAFKRLIGWFNRIAGVNLAFATKELLGGGLDFHYTGVLQDINLANTLGTARRTDALSVPAAFSVLAHVRVSLNEPANVGVTIGNPDETDAAPSDTIVPGVTCIIPNTGVPYGFELWVYTSATGTIYARAGAVMNLYTVFTMGFTWGRR